jgi:hypothetical protein
MLKVTEFNYDHYKKIAEVIWNYTRKGEEGLDPDSHPINSLHRWEKLNKTRAIKGLQLGLHDSIASLRDASDKEKEELNEFLLNADLPSVYNLLTIGQNVPAQVLKRNKIRSIDEYYVLTDILSAVDASLTKEEREKLEGIVSAFEAKRRK